MTNFLKGVFACFFVLFSMAVEAQSSEQIEKLKQQLQTVESDSVKIQLYKDLGHAYWNSHPDTSYQFLKKRLDLAVASNNEFEIAKGNESLGVWLISNGEYARSIQFLSTSLDKFKEIGDQKNVAYVYSSLGYAHLSAYETNEAISYYLKSLKMFREMDYDQGLADLYNEIGNLFYDQKNYEEAKCYFLDGLGIMEHRQDTSGIALIYTNLGNVVSEQENYELGLEYYHKSLDLSELIKDDYGVAVNLNNIGDTFLHMKQYPEAQSYFKQAQEIAKNIHDVELEAVIYLSRGEGYLLNQNYKSAIDYAQKGLMLAKAMGNLDYQAENFKYLAQAYAGLNQFELSNDYFMKYDEVKSELEAIQNAKRANLFNTLKELEDSYFTIDNLSAENELVLSKYLTEKKISYALIIVIVIFSGLSIVLINQQSSKRQAYKLLEYKNFLIARMNEENSNQKKDLEELNKTKDKFFSIIGHDLKNPFNSIQGFSELLIENFDEYDKKKQLKFLKIIKDSSVRATSLLNNLLLWANNQSGNIKFEPSHIQLLKQVADAVALVKIQAVNKEIEIHIDIEPEVYVFADKNMLNTILRNLISNAIKFTDKGGEVHLYSKTDKDFITVFVRDTGIGISSEFKERLFSLQEKSTSVGTNNEQGSGLGLILCQDFVQKNGGELAVESNFKKGSTFYFTIPASSEKNQKKAALNYKTA